MKASILQRGALALALGLALVPALKAAVAGLAFDMVRKLMVERAP